MERDYPNQPFSSPKPDVPVPPDAVFAAARSLADAVRLRRRHSPPGKPLLVALDGGSGAGKSTLALLAAPLIGAAVVHYDDFFDASVADEEWDRCTPGQKCRRCMDWRRARREALRPLLAGEAASYRPFSFETGDRLAPVPVVVRPADIILLDGIYSTLPELADLIGFAVLVDAPPDVRRRRHDEREPGDERDWHARWDPAEDFYFAELRPPSAFDLVLRA
ncbi:Uridine kinase [Paenibacillus sp. UNC496MF]|uniref:uridine kinase family protein n=1 Tax=Paenibacillus sp. UNC496MF TaxID=1502753 RepID=UPI0008DFE556|nr:hypothetical protein [Paenibacillus sp. UNC496MF]SFI35461.1 Uridine kinase [Paenibacillus sp. UNC496MF]